MKEFRQMPTFEMLYDQLQEMRACVAAQGNVIEELLAEVRERQIEIAFLMNLIRVNIPTSKIAGVDGKVPTVSKIAAQLYAEGGRATIAKRFAELEALQAAQENGDGQGLPSEQGASKESSDKDKADSSGPLVTFPHRTTH